MKRIEKVKLPKWLVSNLPFGSEDGRISWIAMSIGLLFLVGIGALLRYKMFGPWLLKAVLFAAALVMVFMFILWLIAQVDLLKVSRQELMLCYKLTEEPEEKENVRKKLEKLYVFIK